MYESRAIGGPLDGVKLAAPLTWYGMIRRKASPEVFGPTSHYAGRYIWRENAWVWVPGTWAPISKAYPVWRLIIE